MHCSYFNTQKFTLKNQLITQSFTDGLTNGWVYLPTDQSTPCLTKHTNNAHKGATTNCVPNDSEQPYVVLGLNWQTKPVFCLLEVKQCQCLLQLSAISLLLRMPRKHCCIVVSGVQIGFKIPHQFSEVLFLAFPKPFAWQADTTQRVSNGLHMATQASCLNPGRVTYTSLGVLEVMLETSTNSASNKYFSFVFWHANHELGFSSSINTNNSIVFIFFFLNLSQWI